MDFRQLTFECSREVASPLSNGQNRLSMVIHAYIHTFARGSFQRHAMESALILVNPKASVDEENLQEAGRQQYARRMQIIGRGPFLVVEVHTHTHTYIQNRMERVSFLGMVHTLHSEPMHLCGEFVSSVCG